MNISIGTKNAGTRKEQALSVAVVISEPQMCGARRASRLSSEVGWFILLGIPKRNIFYEFDR
jgi:hypothetical protein